MIKKYSEFLILETLKSDEIDIVDKKLTNFFTQLGFTKRIGFGDDVKSPYFQIFSDREYLKRRVNEYKDKNNSITKDFIKHGYKQEDFIKMAEDDLSDFRYGDIFIFTDYNSPEISEKLLHLIDSVGYFVSVVNLNTPDDIRKLEDKSKIKETLKNLDKISIVIEPTYDARDNNEGEYLYHTTNKKNLEKIMKFGLIPKSKNTRSFYPERIYLAPNEMYLNSIKNQLNTDKPDEYVDLKIKKFDGLSLYRDVRFKGGFYTYDNIPPKYIEVIK